MYRTARRIIPMAIALGFAASPVLVSMFFTDVDVPFSVNLLLILNLIGWGIVLLAVVGQQLSDRRLKRFARRAGIFPKLSRGEDFLTLLLRDISRRERALSMPHLEKRIHSREELSGALEEVVSTAYELLKGESAELALYDRDSGMYHSAFVKGRPFKKSAQAMLSGAIDRGESEKHSDVLVHPISFAGNVLGTLRIGLPAGHYPDGSDRKLLTLLAAQAALALTNAQYTEQLLRLKTASEESLRAKTGFLANLSHELRAPLGIILNGVEVLVDGLCGPINPDQRATLDMVRDNGEHLLELVNDVLDYAKIESGKLQPKQEDLEVQGLLKDLCAVVRKQADEKRHKISLSAQSDVLAVSCDRRHFRQILLNLLTNAIKYTPDGGSIEVWSERGANNRVEVHVRDNGIGIAPENHPRVFEAFERVEHTYALAQGGTGLGMPLTKRLVERNGGRIEFQSELGRGTEVWVSFPAISDVGLVRASEPIEEGAPDGRGDSVLLLRADKGDALVLEKYLTALNFSVVTALNDEEALEIMSRTGADLIIFESSQFHDWMSDLIENLKNLSGGKDVPILLLTSRAFSFDVEEFLRLGVDRCLLKPARLLEVAKTSRQLIDRDYAGAVIDEEEVTSTGTDVDTRLSISANRLVGVDDLLH